MRSFGVRALRAALCGIALACAFDGSEAFAQCGAKRSTCTDCHDGTQASVPSHDPWHDDHAFADLCPTCHGGNGDAHDATAAHADLVAPLSDANDACVSCHGADASRFRDRYRSVRAADAGAASGATSGPSKPTTPVHGERGPNAAMTIVLVGVGALGALVVGLRERERDRAEKQGVS